MWCVCVYLLKRSKTCTWSWWFFMVMSIWFLWITLCPCRVLLHDLFFSSLTIIHFFQLDTTITAGDARDVGKSGIKEDAFLHLWYRDGTPSLRTCLFREWHAHGDLVETLVMRVGFLFSQAVCFIIKEQGTSSFMTSALDALVFVKVCNLWWVSDKVPQGRGVVSQGRGVVSVQLLSRKTPDYLIRMSNLQILIGNSFK